LKGRISVDGPTAFRLIKDAVEVRPSEFTALHALRDGPYALLVAIVLTPTTRTQ